MGNLKKSQPTREQLTALAAKLNDAPVVGNSAQAALWQSIGRADGWASMSKLEKDSYLLRHDQLRNATPNTVSDPTAPELASIGHPGIWISPAQAD
ncbi:Uncharacterised protein [Burkholderia pseudomallei]|nr:Uncharacterised protein [Burkholderia pseudomallei]